MYSATPLLFNSGANLIHYSSSRKIIDIEIFEVMFVVLDISLIMAFLYYDLYANSLLEIS